MRGGLGAARDPRLPRCRRMNGAVLLARTAVPDMYPESRKARAISYVPSARCSGCARAARVPALFAGKDLELHTLVVPWFAAAAMCVVGLFIALAIRPDPRRSPSSSSARALRRRGADDGAAAPLGQILRRPGVPPAVAGCGRELRGHGQRDGPERLHRRRAPPRAGRRLHRHQPSLVGIFGLVPSSVSSSTASGAIGRLIGGLLVHGPFDGDARLGRRHSGDVYLALPARPRLAVLYVAASAELVTYARPVERGAPSGSPTSSQGWPPRRSPSSAACILGVGRRRDRRGGDGRSHRAGPRPLFARPPLSPGTCGLNEREEPPAPLRDLPVRATLALWMTMLPPPIAADRRLHVADDRSLS